MASVTAPALVWAWANDGRRWHLRANGADLALCGVGKRGWELVFDRNAEDIYVAACIPCLSIERRATTRQPATASDDDAAGLGRGA